MKSLIKPTLFFLFFSITSGLLFSSCSKDTDELVITEYVQDGIKYKLNYSDHYARIIGNTLTNKSKINLPERIEIPTGEEFTVISIDKEAFASCNFITSVTIPPSIGYIFENAFYKCPNLQSVIINGGRYTIGEYSFSDCKNLKSLEIGDLAKSIEHGAFSGCEALNSVKIGNNVETIGDYAFYGDSNIKTLSLGKSMKYIGYRCFWDDNSIWDTEHVMQNVYCYAATPPKYASDPNYPLFRATTDKTTLHVIHGLKNAYNDSWIANMKVLTVNRYPRLVDDLTANGGTVAPTPSEFDLDYKVHTYKVDYKGNNYLYNQDGIVVYFTCSSGSYMLTGAKIVGFGPITHADEESISVDASSETSFPQTISKYVEGRGYKLQAFISNTHETYYYFYFFERNNELYYSYQQIK